MVNLSTSSTVLDRLSLASKELSHLCDLAEKEEEFNQHLEGMFLDVKAKHVNIVASLGQITKLAKSNLDMLKAEKDEISKAEGAYQRIIASVKGRVLKALDEYPDLPWRDWKGGKVYAQANPPKLELDLGKSASLKDVIEEDQIDELPSRYLKMRTYITLDKEAILEDLRAGVEIPFARLVQGKHLRGI